MLHFEHVMCNTRVGLVLRVFGILIVGMTGIQSGANAVPVNDNFARATTVKGASSSIAGTNTGATKQSGEPNPGSSDGYSVWYRWKAPSSGGATFTASSNFNSVLGVYTGTYVNQLTTQTEFQPGLGTETSSATFNAVAGTTYYVLVDDYQGATGKFTLSWQYGPGNDNFAAATTVTGNTISVKGTNANSSSEVNEPHPSWPGGGFNPPQSSQGRSVWYRWTAPASGGVTFTSTGDFDSVVAIYTGLYVDQLTDQTEFRSGLGTDTSSTTFNAISGTTYYVLVDDYEGDSGSFTLTSTWGPVNDNFANATVVSGHTIKVKGTNVNSSSEVNEPHPSWPGGGFNPPQSSQGRSVWYRWTAPASGGVTFTSTGDFDSVVAIYTGLYVDQLTDQTEFRSGLGTGISSATFNAISGTTYSILVDDYKGDSGNFTLTSTLGPANDNFAAATTVTGNTISVKGTNVNSSSEVNEPHPSWPGGGFNPPQFSQGRSVWYRWTAPASGGVTFTSTGDFDSVVAIYTGSTVSSLTNQTEFQPGLGTDTSSATFNAVKGTSYSILVDDYQGETGKFTLTSLWGPANDNFANATMISGSTGSIGGTNVNSSSEVNEPHPSWGGGGFNPPQYSQGRSVWYRWTAPASGGVTFTSTGDFDSVVAIYTGSTVSSLTNQTLSQPGLGTATSSATFNAVKGTTYSILVDDYDGDTGVFSLSW